MTDQRLLKQYRLRRQVDFDRVYERSAHAADEFLVVNACPNGLAYSRLGLSVSRKVGGAVVRNRWKRLMREAFRLCRQQLPSGVDFVLRPRRGAKPDFHAIKQSLPRLAERVTRQLRRDEA
jgi:ribonuclease P protein component